MRKRNDFFVADIYNIKSFLLQMQEQIKIHDDYTKEELKLLATVAERKKEQCRDVLGWVTDQMDFNDSYQNIYRSIYNSIIDPFRDSYQLACDIIHEVNVRLNSSIESS